MTLSPASSGAIDRDDGDGDNDDGDDYGDSDGDNCYLW